MNKNMWPLFTLILITFLPAIKLQAQSCKTGKLDPGNNNEPSIYKFDNSPADGILLSPPAQSCIV